RIDHITETALHDFIDITVFLILGALLAAGTRLFLTTMDIADIGRNHVALAVLAMMALAVVLCLCSEADAFVAASFVTLRPSAKLAFLVLGPMMDFKLYFMYTRIFRPKLIITIYLAVITQVFLYSLAVHAFWEKYAPSIINPTQISQISISEEEVQNQAMKVKQVLGLFSGAGPGGSVTDQVMSSWAMLLLNTSNEAPELRFTQLESAALSPDMRQFYEGKRVSIIGRFTGNEQAFRLTRYRINCCAADAQPLNVAFFLAPGSKETLPAVDLEGKWVRVVGQVRFIPSSTPGSFRAALVLEPNDREPLNKLVEKIPPPANPYVD
ncbi:MAG: permease, partial [Gemmataceae bacterium]